MHAHLEHTRTINARPSILLADDDAGSRLVLTHMLGGLGCEVASADDGPPALTLARDQRFDLLLIDCRMPGGGAHFIATRLRQTPDAASTESPIVATSADVDDDLRRTLFDAGCAALLAKPAPARELEQLLHVLLPAAHPRTVLDDAQALASSGSENVLQQLRALFADELRIFLRDLDTLQSAPAQLAERLHRLRSACDYCGAPALSDAASRVQYLAEHHTLSRACLARLRTSVTTTLDALQQPYCRCSADG